MRYRGNEICPNERTRRTDGQAENIMPSGDESIRSIPDFVRCRSHAYVVHPSAFERMQHRTLLTDLDRDR